MAATSSLSTAAVSILSSGAIWQMIVKRATLLTNLYNVSTMLPLKWVKEDMCIPPQKCMVIIPLSKEYFPV